MIWSYPRELQFLLFFILATNSSSLTVIGSLDIGGNAFLIVSFMLFIYVASRLISFSPSQLGLQKLSKLSLFRLSEFLPSGILFGSLYSGRLLLAFDLIIFLQ